MANKGQVVLDTNGNAKIVKNGGNEQAQQRAEKKREEAPTLNELSSNNFTARNAMLTGEMKEFSKNNGQKLLAAELNYGSKAHTNQNGSHQSTIAIEAFGDVRRRWIAEGIKPGTMFREITGELIRYMYQSKDRKYEKSIFKLIVSDYTV